jgi:arsenate reductase
MSIILYGIPNCDTIKKTKDWLASHQIPYTFHNYKTEGIALGEMERWASQVGWETIINKKGSTWRKLSPEEQAAAKDPKQAASLLQQYPSIIKRPIITNNDQVVVIGFDEVALQTLKEKCK